MIETQTLPKTKTHVETNTTWEMTCEVQEVTVELDIIQNGVYGRHKAAPRPDKNQKLSRYKIPNNPQQFYKNHRSGRTVSTYNQ